MNFFSVLVLFLYLHIDILVITLLKFFPILRYTEFNKISSAALLYRLVYCLHCNLQPPRLLYYRLFNVNVNLVKLKYGQGCIIVQLKLKAYLPWMHSASTGQVIYFYCAGSFIAPCRYKSYSCI